MLAKAKLALRITTGAFDDEIKHLIKAAVKDLNNVGITLLPEDVTFEEESFGDPMIDQAVVLYCKAEFGYQDPDNYKRFRDAYDYLKCALSLAGGYIASES